MSDEKTTKKTSAANENIPEKAKEGAATACNDLICSAEFSEGCIDAE